VFGVIFGAAATPQIGAAQTVMMSLIVVSGALQVATTGLVAGGAGVAVILVTAVALNTRHLVLGALLRPHVRLRPGRRAALSWFLTDESFGIAYASRARAAPTLLVSGLLLYLAWPASLPLPLPDVTSRSAR
jgi:predicted branched-subunit amino acid permease